MHGGGSSSSKQLATHVTRYNVVCTDVDMFTVHSNYSSC